MFLCIIAGVSGTYKKRRVFGVDLVKDVWCYVSVTQRLSLWDASEFVLQGQSVHHGQGVHVDLVAHEGLPAKR